MREVAFLKANADKWKRFEQLVRAPKGTDPDQLAELFVQVTDDLSYAKTFYPKSKTTQYLNGLAGEVHRALYRNRREDRRRLLTFWRDEVPQAMAASRRELLVSFVVFALSMLVGALSAAGDGTFVRLVMGDDYVNMTLQNIDRGDPMGVYRKMQELDMFLAITLNNVLVAFKAFAAGLVASFGTGYVLFNNGVMIGAFHTLFYEQGLLGPSLLVVYIHGALEIPAIVIAGCAGLVLGNSLLFPGTYTRGQSLLAGARRGLKIVVGLVPVFVVAGFVEGFVTRHTGMPVALSLAIIFGSLGFLLWYFVLYPLRWKHPSPSASAATSATS